MHYELASRIQAWVIFGRFRIFNEKQHGHVFDLERQNKGGEIVDDEGKQSC